MKIRVKVTVDLKKSTCDIETSGDRAAEKSDWCVESAMALAAAHLLCATCRRSDVGFERTFPGPRHTKRRSTGHDRHPLPR